VTRYSGIPPYPETQNYVILVRRQLELAKKGAAERPVAAPPPAAAETKPEGPAHIVEVSMPDGSVRYVAR